MRVHADYASALLLILVVEVGAALGRVHLKLSKPAKAVWQLGFRLLTVPVENGAAERPQAIASR